MFGRLTFKLNIRLKIFLVVLPLITLPLLMVGSMSYLYMRENSLRILEHQMELALRGLSTELSQELATARANLDLFASNEVVMRYLGLPDTPRNRDMQSAVLKILSNYRRAVPQYIEVGVYLPDSRSDTLVTDEFAHSQPKEDFYKHLISEGPRFFIDKLYYNNQGDGYIDYAIAQRIQATDLESTAVSGSRSEGYLVLVLRIPNINSRLAMALDLPEGLLALTSSAGEPYFSTLDLDESMQSLINLVVSSGVSRLRSISIDQEYFLGGFYRVTDQLLVTGMITQEVINQIVNPIIWGIFWSVIGFSILSFLLIYSGLDGMLANPLIRLKNQLLDFRAGREIQSFEVSEDEFGELYSLVNKIAESQRIVRAQSKEMFYFDPLTGLPNRHAFTKILDKAVSFARRQDQVFAVLYLDINDFRAFNQLHGDTVGDELVKEASKRIQSCLRISDEVSRQVLGEDVLTEKVLIRTGGDEFSILLRDIKKSHQASIVASRILNKFKQSLEVSGLSVTVDVSIGIAIYPLDGQSPDLLLKSADLAMYDAKQQPGSRFRFFTHALNASSEKRIITERMLVQALKKKQFSLYIQPLVSLTNGFATEFEAFVRWNHADQTVMTQEQYWNVAEDSGNTIELEQLSTGLIFSTAKSLNQNSAEPVRLSFNVMPSQLHAGRLLSLIDHNLKKYTISGQLLEVELSESVIRNAPDEATITNLITNLKSREIKVSLDDFGREDIDISLLKKFAFDRVKISPNIIREMDYDEKNEMLVVSLLKLARNFGLDVIVLGVEEKSTIFSMKHYGANFAQGVYLQSAVPPDQKRSDFREKLFHTPARNS